MGLSWHILTEGVSTIKNGLLIFIIKYDAMDCLSRKTAFDTILVGRLNIDDHNL